MTNKEMRDFVELIYDWLGGPGVNGKVTHDVHIGAARQKCEQLIAALESEPKPLAMVAGQLLWGNKEVWIACSGDEDEILKLPTEIFKEKADDIPVTVTVTERKGE